VAKDVDEGCVGQDQTFFKHVSEFARAKARVDESRPVKRGTIHLNVFERGVADIGAGKRTEEELSVVDGGMRKSGFNEVRAFELNRCPRGTLGIDGVEVTIRTSESSKDALNERRAGKVDRLPDASGPPSPCERAVKPRVANGRVIEHASLKGHKKIRREDREMWNVGVFDTNVVDAAVVHGQVMTGATQEGQVLTSARHELNLVRGIIVFPDGGGKLAAEKREVRSRRLPKTV